MPYGQLIADTGYDSAANHRFRREELGVDSLISAKKRRCGEALTARLEPT